MSDSQDNVKDYTDYFRQKAVTHSLLLHNPASETGDAPPSQQRFTKWNLSELVSGLRTKVSFPALMLEMFEIVTAAQIVYDVKPRAKGAITVLQHVKEGDLFGEEAAYGLALQILTDILKQIWQDHYGPQINRCTTPFFQFNFDNIDITPTGKVLQNEMGWRAEFSFEFQRPPRLSTPPDPGTFVDNVDALGDDTFLGADDLQDMLLAVQ